MEKLITLNYEYDEFSDVIDAKTMEIHHSKHLNTYISNLNGLIEGTKFAEVDVNEILKNLEELDSSIKQGVINNGGGVSNHNIYFTQFKKGTKLEDEELIFEINETFGSLENLQEKLIEAGLKQFGSGWSWLVKKDNKLEVVATANQDSPISLGYEPIIAIDVWEHAYYLKYQNKRAEYLQEIFKILDWEIITKRYKM